MRNFTIQNYRTGKTLATIEADNPVHACYDLAREPHDSKALTFTRRESNVGINHNPPDLTIYEGPSKFGCKVAFIDISGARGCRAEFETRY